MFKRVRKLEFYVMHGKSTWFLLQLSSIGVLNFVEFWYFYVIFISSYFFNKLLIKCNIEECSFDTSTHKNPFLIWFEASKKELKSKYFGIKEFTSTYGIIIRLHVVLMVRLPIINSDQQLKKTLLIGTCVYIWHPFIANLVKNL